jgi:1,4-dihydroxy-2-naphthoate octaprenyltransferase
MTGAKRSKLSIWIQAIRPFAFPASLIPVFIGGALAFAHNKSASWLLFPLVLVCALLFHSGTNVVSEYFDFKKGLDKSYTFGSSRVLVDGLIEPKQVLIAGFIFFAIGFLLGLILVIVRGWPILILGAIGLLGGIFYSANPVGYKYLGLGDIMVFFLMGPLMVGGTYFSLTGALNPKVIYVSLPVTFLVTAILNANNIRDIKYDRQAKIKTLEIILGYKTAKKEYFFLVTAAYLSVIVMLFTKVLSLWSMLTFLSLPPALNNMAIAKRSQEGELDEIVSLDVKTAQLHFLFGLLLSISIILEKFIR